MKRRHFLGLAATSASALVGRGKTNASSEPARLLQPHLLQVLRDPQLVRTLGCRYRELNPAEDDVEILRQAVQAAIPPSVFAGPELQAEAAVQRDFAAGRTVILDGWVLSATEARQCALYSLSA